MAASSSDLFERDFDPGISTVPETGPSATGASQS
jgi:hypothetical protein